MGPVERSTTGPEAEIASATQYNLTGRGHRQLSSAGQAHNPLEGPA